MSDSNSNLGGPLGWLAAGVLGFFGLFRCQPKQVKDESAAYKAQTDELQRRIDDMQRHLGEIK